MYVLCMGFLHQSFRTRWATHSGRNHHGGGANKKPHPSLKGPNFSRRSYIKSDAQGVQQSPSSRAAADRAADCERRQAWDARGVTSS